MLSTPNAALLLFLLPPPRGAERNPDAAGVVEESLACPAALPPTPRKGPARGGGGGGGEVTCWKLAASGRTLFRCAGKASGEGKLVCSLLHSAEGHTCRGLQAGGGGGGGNETADVVGRAAGTCSRDRRICKIGIHFCLVYHYSSKRLSTYTFLP